VKTTTNGDHVEKFEKSNTNKEAFAKKNPSQKEWNT